MTTISELRQVLEPVFAGMLHQNEHASLRLHFRRLNTGPAESALRPRERLEDCSVVAHWRILGEKGTSRELQSGIALADLARAVQSDLQDFIAESAFGWGQLRGSRTLL